MCSGPARHEEPTPIEPDPEKFLDLGVKIDLSKVTPELLKPRSPLTAIIALESDVEDVLPWHLNVVVKSVEHRPEMETPLAIDFGNSNSYAAYMKEDTPVAVLGGNDPENFPTVLHFLEPPDALLTKVEIGRDALAEGERAPSSMVRWEMKRWLLDETGEWETPWKIYPPKGASFTRTRSQLIQIFLQKIILESEKALRSSVTRVGLSYPANFSPRARKRLDGIIEKLKEWLEATHPHAKYPVKITPVSTSEASPDEASAVAIGYVHDDDRFEREVADHLGSDRSFLVGSYDFGGGSIDTALLRFTEIEGEDRVFESKHLSLGGDESFGGDNVTTAVFQILLDRFRSVLSETVPGADFPIIDLNERQAVGSDRWVNQQHLRALAEQLKRYLCYVHDSETSHPPPSGSNGAGASPPRTAAPDPAQASLIVNSPRPRKSSVGHRQVFQSDHPPSASRVDRQCGNASAKISRGHAKCHTCGYLPLPNLSRSPTRKILFG